MPPAPCRVAEYGEPTWAEASALVATARFETSATEWNPCDPRAMVAIVVGAGNATSAGVGFGVVAPLLVVFPSWP